MRIFPQRRRGRSRRVTRAPAVLGLAAVAAAVALAGCASSRRARTSPRARCPQIPRLTRAARWAAGRPGLPAAGSVRPDRFAQPVPRPGRPAGVRRLALQHDLPADHHEHAAGSAPDGSRGAARATAGDQCQPGRHSRGRRARLFRGARHDARLGFPHRPARPAHEGVEGLPRLRLGDQGKHRPRARCLPDPSRRPRAVHLPEPDGLLGHRPAGSGAGERDRRAARATTRGPVGQPALPAGYPPDRHRRAAGGRRRGQRAIRAVRARPRSPGGVLRDLGRREQQRHPAAASAGTPTSRRPGRTAGRRW